jgi:putative peptidoglycan lipid II flippase
MRLAAVRTEVAAEPRVARAAGLISILTVLSRLAGFGRTAMLGWAVGATALGTAYVTANTVPNIIFEIVAGGALAALVVPLLAKPLAAGDKAAVAAAASATLTWTLALLIPLAVVVALAAEPIIAAFAPAGTPADVVDAGALMLRIFAPQLPLYGIAVVLTGVLQAHRRFAWPVLAPLLSSVVVASTYGVFAITQGVRADLPEVGVDGQLILAIGTTLGVVVLSMCLVIPLRSLRLAWRPTWGLAAGTGGAARELALAGAVTIGSQQIAVLAVLWLANRGPTGTVVVFTVAQAVYLLPWAVLAVPTATAVYPALAHAHATDDPDSYRRRLAPAIRGVVLLSLLGAAALVGVAKPAAGFFALPGLAQAVIGLAPGLLGYGLFAVLSRALYAAGAPRAAAAATAVGWCAVAAAAFALSAALPDDRRLLALGLATSVGMLLLGGLLVAAVARRSGRHALDGLPRATGVGLVAAVIAAAAGLGVVALTGDTPTKIAALGQGMLAGAVVAAVFLAVAYPLDRHDVRPAIASVGRRLRRGAARGTGVNGDR